MFQKKLAGTILCNLITFVAFKKKKNGNALKSEF